MQKDPYVMISRCYDNICKYCDDVDLASAALPLAMKVIPKDLNRLKSRLYYAKVENI